LPEEWIKDRKRCEKAKIPADQIVFKTKHEQALEMVFLARKNGVRFKWVGFDGFYGDNCCVASPAAPPCCKFRVMEGA